VTSVRGFVFAIKYRVKYIVIPIDTSGYSGITKVAYFVLIPVFNIENNSSSFFGIEQYSRVLHACLPKKPNNNGVIDDEVGNFQQRPDSMSIAAQLGSLV
jgi:hypothetical protein